MDVLTLALAIVTATAGNVARVEATPVLRSAAVNCLGFTLAGWSPERLPPQARPLPARPRPNLRRPRAAPCFRLASA